MENLIYKCYFSYIVFYIFYVKVILFSLILRYNIEKFIDDILNVFFFLLEIEFMIFFINYLFRNNKNEI